MRIDAERQGRGPSRRRYGRHLLAISSAIPGFRTRLLLLLLMVDVLHGDCD